MRFIREKTAFPGGVNGFARPRDFWSKGGFDRNVAQGLIDELRSKLDFDPGRRSSEARVSVDVSVDRSVRPVGRNTKTHAPRVVVAPTRAITHGAFSPRAMSSPSLRLRRGPQDPGAATPSRSPPRGPFVLPQDRPPRRPRGSAASDASADADPGEQWCGWMCRLCTYKEAPEWSVHNKYIHTGYRTGFGWRAAVRSVRVPPDPAPARSLSSLRRASTSRSRVSPSPSVFGIVPSAPGVPASPSRALVSIPPLPR